MPSFDGEFGVHTAHATNKKTCSTKCNLKPLHSSFLPGAASLRAETRSNGRNKKRNDWLVSKALKHKWLIMVHACSTIPDVLTEN
jgi:hypothetical protein